MQLTFNRREPHHEAIFAIGNGHLGTRARWDELGTGLPGTFINGFYDLRPFVHAEWAYGYPDVFEQMVQIPEPMILSIRLDGVPYSEGELTACTETLDLDTGVYTREYTVEKEKTATVKVEKLISFVHKEVMAMRVQAEYPGTIEIAITVQENSHDTDFGRDPRVADGRVALVPHPPEYDAPWNKRRWHTLPTAKPLHMALRVGEGDADGTLAGEGNLQCTAVAVITTEAEPEESLYAAQEDTSFDDYVAGQTEYLKAFWKEAMIRAGNEEVDRILRWSMFQLLQSTGRGGDANIAAKGLTGEGYGGHTFWDTEMYMLPVYQQCCPEIAKDLLTYRHRMLPAALGRAAELGHEKGAAYPWRTISGRESSGYVPAGTAQYHLNADIAWSFIHQWILTKDVEFLFEQAVEVVLQTARIFHTIGNYGEDGFHIHSVTGPDEYTAQISDNYYTNRMAKHNLLWAKKLVDMIRHEDSPRAGELLERLQVTDEEMEAMEQAGRDMVLLFDEHRGIRKQDSTFLQKPLWDFDRVPESMYPLLLHVHPLTIYRHQVLKQADTLLANVLFPEGPLSVLVRDYEYYEKLTTHDSSLSACAHAMAALQIGKVEEGERHFMESLRLDQDNTHRNTEHGLHLANLGGTLLTLTRGFAGLRFEEDGFTLAPVASERLGGYAFRFYWEGTPIEVSVGEEILITAGNQEEIPFRLYGQRKILKGYGTYPLRDRHTKAVLFDLDGVLTDTAPLHYAAWRQLAREEFGFDLPEEYEHKLAGISRLQALERVLEHGNIQDRFTQKDREQLAHRKNEMYKKHIAHFTPDHLFEGARELLQRLRTAGVKTALVSASRNAPALIEKLEIADLFDAVAHPDAAGDPKPAPDPFLYAAELLQVMPYNCMGVEDARAGIESIRAAGMWELGIGDEKILDTRHAVDHIRHADTLIFDWLEGRTWQM